MDYKKAGVDIEAGYKSVELMKEHVRSTMRAEVLGGLGGFSGAFSLEKIKEMEEPVLLSGTDGCGTKVKLAMILDKHDTIGIDAVAMCVNDIACAGGEPLFFLDYIACGKNYPEKIASIVSGVAEGCRQSGAALIGGETAEHPGLMPEDEYDLAGFAVGIVDQKDLISGKDRELFEDILSNTVSRKIRGKINAAGSWVSNMNQLMSGMNTSSGLKLSLKWRSKTAEAEDQLDTGELVQLLKKDYLSMTDTESQRLSAHFRSKVEEARRSSGEQAGLVSFYQVMKDTLDYRKWFEFQLFAQKTGERQKELTNSVFGTFSGGEKAMAMYVPLFSAVVAKYEGGSKNAPRLISLDEAFAGVDSRNIRDMFRLMSEFEFDFIINSQVLWGDCDTLDALAIYQLQRPGNAKFVTVMSYLWNGRCRETLEDESMVEERSR